MMLSLDTTVKDVAGRVVKRVEVGSSAEGNTRSKHQTHLVLEVLYNGQKTVRACADVLALIAFKDIYGSSLPFSYADDVNKW